MCADVCHVHCLVLIGVHQSLSLFNCEKKKKRRESQNVTFHIIRINNFTLRLAW